MCSYLLYSFIIAIAIVTMTCVIILHPLGCNLISVLVLASCFNRSIMVIFQSTWLQLDISPCFGSHVKCHLLVLFILHSLLGSALFTAPRLFLLGIMISQIFDDTKMYCKSCQSQEKGY